jgi:hypothetical protein
MTRKSVIKENPSSTVVGENRPIFYGALALTRQFYYMWPKSQQQIM